MSFVWIKWQRAGHQPRRFPVQILAHSLKKSSKFQLLLTDGRYLVALIAKVQRSNADLEQLWYLLSGRSRTHSNRDPVTNLVIDFIYKF